MIAWINAVIRNPETGKPFKSFCSSPSEHAFTLDEEGRAVYPELVYSAPKKSGKTGFVARRSAPRTNLSSPIFSGIKKKDHTASLALRDRAYHQYRDHLPRLGCDHHRHRLRRRVRGRRQSQLTVGDSASSRRLWDQVISQNPAPTSTRANTLASAKKLCT